MSDDKTADRCQYCGAENIGGQAYCGACGKKFVARATDVAVPGDDGAFYCHKHKREVTRLRCGKCDLPICTKCAIIGVAGVRCRNCARNKVRIRARGVVHDMTSGVSGAVGRMGARPVWYLYIWSIIIRVIAGFFGRW